MNIYSAALTLILVMDPLGNIPVFLPILDAFEPKKRRMILAREIFIAFVILSVFLFFGKFIMHGLNITEPALSIAGGIILFLIALKMIFPPVETKQQREHQLGEPFIVPLAIPLTAGPSALATVLLFATQSPKHMFNWFIAIVIATVVFAIIMFSATALRRFLGRKGLIAIERLMGMILTTISVQMFLTGLSKYLIVHG